VVNFFKIFLKDANQKAIEKLSTILLSINSLESSLSGLDDEGLRRRSLDLRKTVLGGASLESVLPESFALVRESAKRTLGQRAFDSQLLGGIVLWQGKVAEMKTGEGKTLAATMPAYLHGLTGKGVHVVTVNDYLAQRDAVWMGQIFHLLGLSLSGRHYLRY